MFVYHYEDQIKSYLNTLKTLKCYLNLGFEPHRKLNTLLFCPQGGCSEFFEDKASYDEHLLQGRHTIGEPDHSLMDKAKQFRSSNENVITKPHSSNR